MILFTPSDLQDIDTIVNQETKKFIAQNIGLFPITRQDREMLKKEGFDLDQFNENANIVNLAFKFGMFETDSTPNYSKDITLDQFKKIVTSNKFLPLTDAEKAALQSVQMPFAQDVNNFANKIGYSFKTQLSVKNKEKKEEYENQVANLTKQAIIKRQTVQQLASELYHNSDSISRDLIRVAQYQLHTANEYGSMSEIERVYGKDAKVYKVVYAGSCQWCNKLFIKNGEPIQFTLDELRANGTNIGRKNTEWKATIDSIHPYCRCSLRVVPPAQSWNKEKKEFEYTETLPEALVRLKEKEKLFAEKRRQRGLVGEEVKKAFKDLQMANNKALNNQKIPSIYKCVNEYEKEFIRLMAKLVDDINSKCIEKMLQNI